jgi:hypothetical protein
VPAKPPAAPVISSVSDIQIQLVLDVGAGNGGTPITAHSLEINAGGTENDVYSVVTSYDGTAGWTVHTLTVSDGLVAGTIYKVRYRAQNDLGYGEYSDVSLFAFNALPSAPAAPTRVDLDCTQTQIAVSWASMEPSPSLSGNTVTGYNLYAAREQSNIFNLVYNGTGFPQIMSTIVTGLTAGDRWDFKVTASNFNGEGT